MASDKQLGLTVAGVAGFQLLQAWNANAPSLATLRESSPSDTAVATQLRDADVMVGGIALILGVSTAIISNDKTALIVMSSVFGLVSLWHHAVFNGEAT